MSFLASRPRLRQYLDVQQFEHEGQPVLLLRDPLEIAPEPAILPAAFGPLLARLDGQRSLAEIEEEGRPFGVTEDLLSRLVAELDALYLLESERLKTRTREVEEEFNAQSYRPPVFADVIYPSDPEKLSQALERYARQACSAHIDVKQKSVHGIMAPHIDYRRGALTYGVTSRLLSRLPKPDVIVLMGTSHGPGQRKFSVLRKGLGSPYGTFPVAVSVVEQLGKLAGEQQCFSEEMLHRREHSLELQLPLLGYRYAQEALPEVLPILVGSFSAQVRKTSSQAEDAEITDFVQALAEVIDTMRQAQRTVMFYAGVDLAHVGQHFGDRDRVAPNELPEIEKRDRQLLDVLRTGNEQALFEHIAEDQDRRRICGFPTLYTLLAAYRQLGLSLTGEILEYRQAADESSDCVVTFATGYWSENS